MKSQPSHGDRMASSRRGRRGHSLIEALLASAMLVVIAVPIFAMLEASGRIFGRGGATAALQQDLRATVDQMARELRMAGFDPSVTGNPAFDVAGAATVRFVADADADGTTDRIEYSYDGQARTVTRRSWRWAGGAWGPAWGPLVVARNVDSLALGYFDATDGPAATLADIRRITIALAASKAVPGHGLERLSVASEARPRNLL